MEMIAFTSSRARNKAPPVKLLPGIERVESLKILGVHIDHNLSVSMHIGNACQTAAQCLYAIKLVKAHGLDQISVYDVCTATVVTHLTYCINAWWGFANVADKQKLQALLNRAIKWGFYAPCAPSIEQIA